MFRIQSALRQLPSRTISFGIGATVALTVYALRISCSTTGTACEGDHVHLGDEWAFLGLPEGGHKKRC